MNEDSESHKRLVLLIRRLAREEANQVLDEHLSDYEHREKPADEIEAE